MTARTRARTRWRWAAMGAVASAAVMAMGVAVYVYSSAKDAAEPDDYGAAQIIDPAPSGSIEAPVDVRSGCRIVAFGVAPWLRPGAPKDAQWERRTHKALAAMGVPMDAASEAIKRMRAGASDDAIGMGNVEGVAMASGQYYLPSFSTTYAKNGRGTVCRDSATRFASDHRAEYAVVYRIQHGDKTYHLGEFLACGNVSRFFPAPAGSGAMALRWQDEGSAQGAPGRAGPAPGKAINHVPEPGTWALICAALVGIGFSLRQLCGHRNAT